jgi:hypothetical protein
MSYKWSVTNNHTSPIVYVEFPHYHAGLFWAPDGWATEISGLVRVGFKDEPGVCTARAKTARSAIAPGQTGTFEVQIAPLPTKRGEGAVLIRFADGTEVSVGKVELPQPERVGDKYAPLIGLAVIFAAWALIRAIHLRKRQNIKTSKR